MPADYIDHLLVAVVTDEVLDGLFRQHKIVVAESNPDVYTRTLCGDPWGVQLLTKKSC